MKKLFTISILLLVSIFSSQDINAQCEIPNSSYELWLTDVLSVEGPMSAVSNDAMLPDSTTSLIRFFFMAFGAAFDQDIADIVATDPQGFLGISQSTDASEGEFAVKLQGGYDLTLADIYAPHDCTEAPDTFYVDVKLQDNNGVDPDTLSVILLFDQGLAPLPGSPADIANSPSGAFQDFIYTSDSSYHTLALPITHNFEAPIDTFYYWLASTTHDDSYFLIDNLRFADGEDMETCMFDGAPAFSIDGTSAALCICDEFDEGALINGSLTTSDMYSSVLLVVDADDDIVGISEPESVIYDDELCEDGLLSVVELHYTEVDGMTEGSNLADLTGCFQISEKLLLESTLIPEFEFSIEEDGIPVEDEEFVVCLFDDVIATYSFNFATIHGFTILVLDDDGIVVGQYNNVTATTFEGLDPGEYTVGIIQQTGDIPNIIGMIATTIFDSGECVRPSANSYDLIVEDNTGACTSATNDPALLSGFRIVENPVQNFLILDIDISILKDAQLSIADANGSILEERIQVKDQKIDVSNLSSGIYFITVQSEKAQATRKFIKI